MIGYDRADVQSETEMVSATKRDLLILGIAIILNGCASPLPKQQLTLQSVTDCCRDYSAFKYQPIAVSSVVTSELSPRSPAFTFPEGKSFFSAYSLSGDFEGGTVFVGGYGNGFSSSDTTWFYPAVTLLDQNFQLVGYSDVGVPIHSGNEWVGETMIENRLTPIPATARYVIVHFPERARDGTIGGSLNKNDVQVVNGKAVNAGPSTLTMHMPLSPFGKFKLAVLPAGQKSPDDRPRTTFWYHISGLKDH